MVEYPDVLNVEQVARILKLSTKTVYKQIREKRIRAFKSGREYRIKQEWLDEYTERGD